jgi:hypothetical protein
LYGSARDSTEDFAIYEEKGITEEEDNKESNEAEDKITDSVRELASLCSPLTTITRAE